MRFCDLNMSPLGTLLRHIDTVCIHCCQTDNWLGGVISLFFNLNFVLSSAWSMAHHSHISFVRLIKMTSHSISSLQRPSNLLSYRPLIIPFFKSLLQVPSSKIMKYLDTKSALAICKSMILPYFDFCDVVYKGDGK